MSLSSTYIIRAIVVLALYFHCAGDAKAAQASFSTTAPTLGPDDIANLTGASGGGSNVSSGDPNATYLADDRPVQGQVFTSGANPSGYLLTAVTLRHVPYSTYALVPDLTYTIRITRPLAGTALSVAATETAIVPASTPNNIPTIDGGNSEGPGSGRYVTFTFANPIALSPNATYGFDVTGGTARHYWECDGTSSDAYSGGAAYSTGANGAANLTRTARVGDRIFVLALARAESPVVTPPTVSPGTNVYAGAVVTISASAAGSAPLRYRWQWDDGLGAIIYDVPGGNTTNIVVDTTNLSGTFLYHVIVTNSFGATTSAPVRLIVNPASAPVITTDTTPSAATRYVGQSVTFTAAFDGSPPISYQWLNFSQPIPGASNTTLTLTNLQLADAQSYSLLASNSLGTTTSIAAELTVLTPPPPPASGTYTHAALTNEPIAYWRFNDPVGTQFIYDSAGSHNASNSAVTLGEPGLRPPAYPGFPADNTAGSFNNSAATTGADLNGLTNFTVIGWFNPSGPNGPFAGLFGQNDLLEVGYSDGAGVNVWIQLNGDWHNPRTGPNGFTIGSWYFVAIVADGTAADIYINGVRRVHDAAGPPTATSLFGFNIGGGGIFGASGDNFTGLIEDVGIFDRALSQEQIQRLYDAGAGATAPSILTQPRSQTLYAGRAARFTAEGIGGTPPLTYQWQYNGANLANGGKISGANTASLLVANVAPADMGNYRLIISNSAGSVTSSVVALTVVQPTGTPYESAAINLKPVAYWRLNETGDPSTGTEAAHDYVGGLAGTYGTAALNAFNNIPGPTAVDGFGAFEITNTALESRAGTDESWVTVPALNLSTVAVSFTMWIKPNGTQSDYAGLFMTRSGTSAGIGYGGDFSSNRGQLIYTWNNDSTWTFQSGLTIPSDYWSFVAVVIEPTKATLYLYNTNAQISATNAIPHTSEAWAGPTRIGGDPNNGTRTFNGDVDEVAVFNKALTPAQVSNLYNGVSAGRLTIQRSATNLTLGWSEGVLQEATSLTGPWTPVNGATAPSHTVTTSGPMKFYRVRLSP